MHQIGKVDEFIKKFDRVRARLLLEKSTLDERIFVSGFISGLKEEIKHPVELFNPRGLNNTFQCALKVEAALETHNRRPKEMSRNFKYQKPVHSSFNKKGKNEKLGVKEGRYHKPWQQMGNSQPPTYEQRKELGLCHKCHGKYFPGHQCTGKVMRISVKSDSESNDSEEEQEAIEQNEESDELIEQAMISMFTSNDKKKMNSMRFKGHIGKLPICALLDSASTHFFVNPMLVKKLDLTNPMVVRVANGEAMVTDTICKGLRFDLQGFEFEKEVRLLAIQGYDMILGLDWLTSLGPMKIDWGKGTLEFKLKDQNVKLRVKEESAELRLMETECIIEKEIKKGSEVIVAQLFRIEEGEKKMIQISPKWQKILDEFKEVFEEPIGLPPRRFIDHKISLIQETKTVNQRPYRFSYFQKLEIERIIEELLKCSLIQESTSPFASPVLLVKKKDGSWRLCIDYRQLNSNTVKNKYPILIIEDILDELHGAKFFSKIDLRFGYHQIRMHETDVYKTAFRTHQGHFEFLVMPFGLTNAPVTFQALMNQVFKEYLRKFIMVFFDDILVYSRNEKDHQEHLRITLKLLKENQLFAKRSKCEFGLVQLEYLGHIISIDGVATDPKKVEAMVSWPQPKNVRALRGLLGLTGYYRRFIKGYGMIARPLTEQLKKNAFGWSEEAEEAFQKLKEAMVSAPVLAVPDFIKPFILETDTVIREYELF